MYFAAISWVNWTQLDTIELTGHTSSCTKYICLWGSGPGHSLRMQLRYAQYKLDLHGIRLSLKIWREAKESPQMVLTNILHLKVSKVEELGKDDQEKGFLCNLTLELKARYNSVLWYLACYLINSKLKRFWLLVLLKVSGVIQVVSK